MADIFISYKREDRDKAEALAKFLADRSHTVWWDTSLQAGESFSDVIERKIDAAKKVIVLWSKASIASYWVRAEAGRGLQQNKLIAARIEECSLPLPFTQIHTVMIQKIPDDFAQLLNPIASAGTVYDDRQIPDSKNAKRLAHRFRRISLRQTLVTATVVLCAAIGYIVVNTFQPLTPQWQIKGTTFIGGPIPLEWIYATRAGNGAGAADSNTPISFEVEYDVESQFLSSEKKSFYTEGSQRPVLHINGSRYWRIRAVDDRNKLPVSDWSRSIRITQYDSSYRRIESTSIAVIGVSDTDYDDVFKWKDNGWYGFDIALGEAVVNQLSARIGWHIDRKIIAVPWNDLLDQPGLGRADMVISALSKNDFRRKKYKLDFSETYFCTTQSLIFRTGESARTIAEMIAGKRVGYEDNSTSANLVTAMKDKYQFSVRNFDRPEKMIYAILNKDIDFAVADSPFAADAQRTTRQRGANRLEFKEFAATDFPESFPAAERYEQYAFGIRTGDELLPAVDTILKTFKTDGTLGKLFVSASQEFERAKGTGLLGGAQLLLRERPWECRR